MLGRSGGLFGGSLIRVGASGYLVVEASSGRRFLNALYGNDGSSWQRRSYPCRQGDAAVVGGSGGDDLVAACLGYRGSKQYSGASASADGGRHWRRLASPPPVGIHTTLAVATPGTVFLGGSRGLLAVTRDDGQSWHQLRELGGAGWSQVEFVSPTVGFALPYLSARTTHLVLTTDDGRTWQQRDFQTR
jgi:photosystem II stability/assembly factor-like uncharacterized protein